MLVLVLVSFIYVFRIALEKCKDKQNQELPAPDISMDNLGANPDSAQNPRLDDSGEPPAQGCIPAPILNLNNNLYNPEIITLPRFIMVLVIVFVICITTFLYIRNPNAKILNVIIGTLVSILPIVFYIKNPAICGFVRDEMFNF